MPAPGKENLLYYGDNLDVMRRHIGDESVDLIYLDPPFNGNRAFNVFFQKGEAEDAESAQVQAFEDTWYWDEAAARAYKEVVEGGDQAVSQLMRSFTSYL